MRRNESQETELSALRRENARLKAELAEARLHSTGTAGKLFKAGKERLSFMQRVADALPIPVYYKNMQGVYIGYNEAFEKFITSTGSGDSALVGSTVLDVHAVLNRRVGMQIEKDEKAFLADPGRGSEKTYVLKTWSGDTRVVTNKKNILYDSDDKPKYLVGGVLDITGLKLAEKHLRQTTAQLNTTLNAMSEMIMCFDADLTLLWANRAARTALGGSRKRFTGRNWRQIWEKGENPDSEDRPVWRVMKNSLDFSTGKIKTKDGHIYEVHAYPVRSRGKKLTGVVEVALDITEHEAVKARARIHQEQLMLADKMKSLGVLIGGVAHEINNPNNFISINIGLLEKIWKDSRPALRKQIKHHPEFKLGNIPACRLEASIDDLLSGIKDGSERIGRIIDSLKTYMRNAPNDVKQPFNLNLAVENAIFLLKNQIVKATTRFTVTQRCEIIPVCAVRQKIEQVIINVLQNACQALSSRSQRIEVESFVDPEKSAAVVKITDSGIGIVPENLKYITDPFFTTKRESGGTGLGLSISSAILEDCKGRFNFTSGPGKGTSVEIILPLADESAVLND
ncbi:MAG: ATP-binding protein [Victivallaceae bacterium]|nr:ATP-binding protein [Victivallaceae bacterium]